MNLFTDICDSVVEAVSAHPDFWTAPVIPVLNTWRADHLQKLDAAGARLELCAVVSIVRIGAEGGEWGVINPLVVRVLLCENLGANGTGKHADALALSVAATLTGSQYPGAETPFEFLGITPVEAAEFPAKLPEGTLMALAAVDFSLAIRVPGLPEISAAPVITANQTVVTMTGPGGMHILRYTADGTTPTPASLLYVAPLALPASGVTLRARVFELDKMASPVAEWTAE